MRRPAAVLWDFDGSLVNSEAVWERTERGLARELGGELPADYTETTIGGTVDNTAAYIVATLGVDARPADVAATLWRRVMAQLASGPIPWMPGARELLDGLTGAGVPMGLVSSGHRDYLELVLRRLDPMPFAAVVAGDEVGHGKPHPEPYLTACAALGVDPADCLAIEDSTPGATSANAAGCAVLLVPTVRSVPDAPRRVRRPTLVGIDAAHLFTVYAAATH